VRGIDASARSLTVVSAMAARVGIVSETMDTVRPHALRRQAAPLQDIETPPVNGCDHDVAMGSVERTYHVRPASAADLPAVLTILAETQAERPGEAAPMVSQPSDRQEAAWERVMATTDLTVYLAETQSEAVGTASMMLMPHITYDCRPTAFIEAVVVKYAHRRRGVATLLLQEALNDARAASCLKVQLLSHKRHVSDGAHHLYQTMGFLPEAEGFRLYMV
jgi:GNAT superfamily N-acetyltransferase